MSDTDKISLDIVDPIEESTPFSSGVEESKTDPTLAKKDVDDDSDDDSDGEDMDADIAAILEEAAPKMECYSGSLESLLEDIPSDLNIYRVDSDHLTMVPKDYEGKVITLKTGDGVCLKVTEEVVNMSKTWKNSLVTTAEYGSGDNTIIPADTSHANSIILVTIYMHWLTTNTPKPIERPLKYDEIDKIFEYDWEKTYAKYIYETTTKTIRSGHSNKDTLLFRTTLDAHSIVCLPLLDFMCALNALIIKSGDKELITSFFKGTALSKDQKAEAEKNKWAKSTD